METFIVRIYRRITEEPRDAAGTVEHVETGERMPFTDTKELLQRLLGSTVPLRKTCADAAPDGPDKPA